MAGLADQEAALRTQQVIERTVNRLIDQKRPSDRYGTVVSITQDTRICAVQLAGEDGTTNVRFGAIQPTQVGQVVRIGGNAGDRWIVDVIGQAALTGLSLGDLTIPDGITFTQFGAAGLIDWEQGSTLTPNNTIGDGFNRADEALSVSPDWNSQADIDVVSNELERGAVGTGYAAHVSEVDDYQNMYAQIKVVADTSELTGTRAINLEISRDNSTADGTAPRVFVRYDQDAVRYELYSFNGTTSTLEGFFATAPPTFPYTLKLDRKGDTYTVYENDNPVIVTDITGRNGSYTGFHFQDANEMLVDDFAAGSYVNNFTIGSAYEVQLADDDQFTVAVRSAQTVNSQYVAKDLTPGNTYYARVRAVSGTTASAWSATVSYTATSLPLTTVTDGSVPTDSPDVTCTGGIGWVLAEWPTQLNDDPVTYEVYVSDESGFTPSPATKVGETTGTFYTVRQYADASPLSYEHNVFVRVIAKDADGPATVAGAQGFAKPLQVELGDVGNTVDFGGSDGSAPADKPLSFTVASGIGFLYCKWDHVVNGDAVTYEIHLSDTTSFTPTANTLVGDTPANFTFIRKLPPGLGGGPLVYGTTYYLIVWAKDDDGYAPTYSDEVTANTAKATQLDFDDLSVGTAQIIDLSVSGAKIADLAVGTAKIENAAITTGKINDLAVGTAAIADLNVTEGKIANLAVSNAKIADLAVTNAKIALLAVDTAQIQNAAIENAQLANLSVSTGKIQSLAVDTAQIATAAITDAKVSDLSADKLTAGTINANIITVTNINASNITTGALNADRISGGTIDGATITVDNLNANNITTGSLSMTRVATGAITGDKIGNDEIDTPQIATNAVENPQIADFAVNTPQIAGSAVGTTQLDGLAVTTAKIGTGAVTNVKIGDAEVSGAKIATATITDANIDSLNAGKITAGTMSADRISGGTISGNIINGGTISGTIFQTSSSGQRVVLGGTYPNDVTFYGSSGGAVRFYGSGGIIQATNSIFLTAGDLQAPGDVRAGTSFEFIGDTDTGMYRAGANDVRIRAGGNDKIRCYSTGVLLANERLFADGLAASTTLQKEAIMHYTGGGHEIFRDTSSGRLKYNQQPRKYKDALPVLQLEAKSYDAMLEAKGVIYPVADPREPRNPKRKGQEYDVAGFVAEDVEKFWPDAVVYDEEDKPTNIDWNRIHVSLIQVVQEHHRHLESLQANLAIVAEDLDERLQTIERGRGV